MERNAKKMIGGISDEKMNSSRRRGIFRYSTAAAVEEPINPSVNVNYTQHLINGQFVDAASDIGPQAEGDAEDVNRAVLAA
uniref:Uncharacterized protein n=1 Tax=Vitis vinifera TaxID=29760 RepID=F6GVK9_VITVI